MKRCQWSWIGRLALIAGITAISGCGLKHAILGSKYLFFHSPYENQLSWFVRQNATPQYFNKFDVFYLGPKLFTGSFIHKEDRDYIVRETVIPFNVKARCFAPIFHNEDEALDALYFYFGNYHGKNRPFVLIAEGEGAKALPSLIEASDGKGLVAVYSSTNITEHGFVTAEIVTNAIEAVKSELYYREWGR